MLAFLSFDERGQYRLDTPEQREAAMRDALRSIAIIPQAYGNSGSTVQITEMQRTAVELLKRLR